MSNYDDDDDDDDDDVVDDDDDGDVSVQNADLGCIPNFEHNDAMYWEKSEQLHYNVEDRDRVEGRYKVPPREQLLKPEKHHPASRYRSSMLSRKLGDDDDNATGDDYDVRRH